MGSNLSGNKIVKILALGDSLTEGYNSRGYFGKPFHPYTIALQSLLAERFPAVTFEIANFGSSGERAVDMPARLDLAFEQVEADIAVFLGGTNDIGWGANKRGKTAEAVGQEVGNAIADAIERMAAAAEKRGTVSLLLTPFEHGAEARSDFGHGLVARTVLRDRLAAFAAEHADTTTLFDLGAAMPFDNALFGDLLHPTPEGYDHMGKLVFEALIPIVEKLVNKP